MADSRMSKKTIIITGVSSGLGRALFDIVSAADVRLICISRSFLKYQTASAGEDLVLLPCDLGKLREVTPFLQKLAGLLKNTSDITFISNAATIEPIGSVGELDDAAILAAVQTNYVSPMRITNMLCALKNAQKLSFIYVSTGAARTPIVGWSLYCSTKAALKMFFTVLEAQYKNDKRVSVHEFDPGVIDTPMQAQIRKSSKKDFPRLLEFKVLKKTHMLSDPHDVAKKLVNRYIHV